MLLLGVEVKTQPLFETLQNCQKPEKWFIEKGFIIGHVCSATDKEQTVIEMTLENALFSPWITVSARERFAIAMTKAIEQEQQRVAQEQAKTQKQAIINAVDYEPENELDVKRCM